MCFPDSSSGFNTLTLQVSIIGLWFEINDVNYCASYVHCALHYMKSKYMSLHAVFRIFPVNSSFYVDEKTKTVHTSCLHSTVIYIYAFILFYREYTK
jgi:hypothetical protein